MMQPDHELVKIIADPQDCCAIWPVDRPNPPRWRDLGVVGSRTSMLDFLDHLAASAPCMRQWFERGARTP